MLCDIVRGDGKKHLLFYMSLFVFPRPFPLRRKTPFIILSIFETEHFPWYLTPCIIVLLQLMDFYSASGITILWTCFFQTIAIGWIFGARRFAECVEQMTGYRPSMYWTITWGVVAPLVMAVSLWMNKNRLGLTNLLTSFALLHTLLQFECARISLAFAPRQGDAT